MTTRKLDKQWAEWNIWVCKIRPWQIARKWNHKVVKGLKMWDHDSVNINYVYDKFKTSQIKKILIKQVISLLVGHPSTHLAFLNGAVYVSSQVFL